MDVRVQEQRDPPLGRRFIAALERALHRWWRFKTTLRLLRANVRAEWGREFLLRPELCNARFYADNPDKGHEAMAYGTFAGFYNDHVTAGHMSVQQAWVIYQEAKRGESA